ncbi:thioredoxin family protein [Fulvivirgaceae bacterium BMA12]|uniref:Thioredoxin family protein n=1 Tax=Agaribacillus aureus TaxID=3051825 RepID=A0ABT8LIE6_9BACT|nr:thioredoxin family protein [Fulvivirgaceae bacterium BMA12]
MHQTIINRKVKLVFKILGLFSILLVYTSNQLASNVSENRTIWMTDYEQARSVAEAEDKPILIYFSGSDWCKPCIKLSEQVFEREEFRFYARENLILLKLDFPRYKRNQLSTAQADHNEALAARFNREGDFPLVLIIDKHENVIAQTGYRNGDVTNFVSYVNENLVDF